MAARREERLLDALDHLRERQKGDITAQPSALERGNHGQEGSELARPLDTRIQNGGSIGSEQTELEVKTQSETNVNERGGLGCLGHEKRVHEGAAVAGKRLLLRACECYA